MRASNLSNVHRLAERRTLRFIAGDAERHQVVAGGTQRFGLLPVERGIQATQRRRGPEPGKLMIAHGDRQHSLVAVGQDIFDDRCAKFFEALRALPKPEGSALRGRPFGFRDTLTVQVGQG